MRGFGYFLGVLAWMGSIAALIWVLNIGALSPISGAIMIDSGQMCSPPDCGVTETVQLPLFAPVHRSSEAETREFSFDLTVETVPTTLQALYLPSFADEIHVRVNGVPVWGQKLENRSPARMWNMPVLASVPPSLIVTGQNRIDLSLYGYPQEGLILERFYFGPLDLLAPHYDWRFAMTTGMARFNLGIMVIVGIMLAILWLARRSDPIYAILAISCVFASIICVHFGFDTSSFSYRWWSLAWLVSVSFYVFLILKFCNHYIGEGLKYLERIGVIMIAAEIAVVCVVPDKDVFATLLLFKLHPALMSFVVLSILIGNRRKVADTDFRVFVFFLSMSSAMGVYELYITAIENPGRNQHIFQFMPLMMLCVCLWLVLSRFMLSLSQYEDLTGSLKETIAAKTEELRQSYEKLGNAERLKAINAERERIMLDLHDGIGGQLVNTLAYIQNNTKGDETIKAALEDALRDLSLMLDSLETDASISTLLGMLRTRLETLLAEHQLEFEWQIEDEPKLPNPGPSQNLNLLRIVQEGITNIIKHAEASVITVASDDASITVSDNGKGFDVPQSGKNRGHGLVGMRRRAKSIGADFDLRSTPEGTTVRLVWR